MFDIDQDEKDVSMASRDTEITLGTGKLLGLFFGLVVLCALCVGIGYQIGRNSASTQPQVVEGTAVNTTGSTAKPGSGVTSRTPVTTNTPAAATSTSTVADQRDAATTPEKPEAAASPDQTAADTRPSGGYLVQIAAVTKQEDAQALTDALKRKNYPVFIASSAAADKYFRVQVGPFADLAQAEAMRKRLVADGYNPILKK